MSSAADPITKRFGVLRPLVAGVHAVNLALDNESADQGQVPVFLCLDASGSMQNIEESVLYQALARVLGHLVSTRRPAVVLSYNYSVHHLDPRGRCATKIYKCDVKLRNRATGEDVSPFQVRPWASSGQRSGHGPHGRAGRRLPPPRPPPVADVRSKPGQVRVLHGAGGGSAGAGGADGAE